MGVEDRGFVLCYVIMEFGVKNYVSNLSHK